MQKMGWFGAVRGHSNSSAMPPFDKRIRLPIRLNRNHASILYRFYRAMLGVRGTSHGPVSVCLSVSVSVTSRSSTKTAKRRIKQTTPHDRIAQGL